MDNLIMEIIQREGAKDTDNPNDPGGRTKYGISEKSNPSAWKNGPPTLDAAKQIYMDLYVNAPGFTKIQPSFLMNQLVDFGVNSGPKTAIMHLQKLLGLTQDGVIGPSVLATLAKRNPETLNNQLADDRV